MTNTTSPYDPIFYAQEGLIQLEKALGMAGRVHRGYDKTPQQLGSTIQIRRPGTFSAQSAPSSAQALNPESLTITLNQWKEVKFGLTDKELAYTGQQIIDEHIRPAAYALADAIDQALAALYYLVPYTEAATIGSVAVTDLINARKVLFNNRAPVNDTANMHGMVDGNFSAELLALAAFTQYNTGGDQALASLMRGAIGNGPRFGVNWFENQNTPTHSSGTCADVDGAIDNGAGYAAGSTTIHIDGVTSGGTAKAGDIVTISGHTKKYAITTDVTFTSGEADVVISPGLESAVVDDQVVALVLGAGSGGSNKGQQLVFHRNAFALAMAPLPTLPSSLGARVETVTDPKTGLSLRARMYYDGDNSQVLVALDCLYGVKVLDERLACRILYL